MQLHEILRYARTLPFQAEPDYDSLQVILRQLIHVHQLLGLCCHAFVKSTHYWYFAKTKKHQLFQLTLHQPTPGRDLHQIGIHPLYSTSPAQNLNTKSYSANTKINFLLQILPTFSLCDCLALGWSLICETFLLNTFKDAVKCLGQKYFRLSPTGSNYFITKKAPL